MNTGKRLADALRACEDLLNASADSSGQPGDYGRDCHDAMVAAREALADYDAAPGERVPAVDAVQRFTVFITDWNGRGGTFITSVQAADVEQAKRDALLECAGCWGYEDDADGPAVGRLRVLGVSAGDVEILEWEDYE